jgi:dihydrofolate reductase
VVTEIDQVFEGDRLAPTLGDEWQPTASDAAWQTSTNGLRYRVRTYVRGDSPGF